MYSDSMDSPRLKSRPGTGTTRSTGLLVYLVERVSCLENASTSVQPGVGCWHFGSRLWLKFRSLRCNSNATSLRPDTCGYLSTPTQTLLAMPRGAATPHVNRDTAQEMGEWVRRNLMGFI